VDESEPIHWFLRSLAPLRRRIANRSRGMIGRQLFRRKDSRWPRVDVSAGRDARRAPITANAPTR